MASISGSVTIAGDPDDWIACAFDADTHAFAGVAAVSAGAYEITGLTAGRAYVVACRPKSGPAWAANRVTQLHEYTLPTDAETTPYIYKATTAQVGDIYFDSVALLLHMDGENNSTTFTDVTGKTITAQGQAKITTSQSKFGGSSAVMGTGYVSLPSSEDFNFGTGDFCIEGWVYPSGTGAFFANASTTNHLNFYFDSSTSARMIFNNNNVITGISTTANAWQHIAVSRDGANLRVFVNGVQKGSTYNIGTSSAGANAANTVGGQSGMHYFNGYIDEVRITKGVSRYAGEFTPPAAPFDDQAGTPTGLSEPSWGVTPGGTTNDGDVVWTNMGQLVRPLMHGPLIAA